MQHGGQSGVTSITAVVCTKHGRMKVNIIITVSSNANIAHRTSHDISITVITLITLITLITRRVGLHAVFFESIVSL